MISAFLQLVLTAPLQPLPYDLYNTGTFVSERDHTSNHILIPPLAERKPRNEIQKHFPVRSSAGLVSVPTAAPPSSSPSISPLRHLTFRFNGYPARKVYFATLSLRRQSLAQTKAPRLLTAIQREKDLTEAPFNRCIQCHHF